MLIDGRKLAEQILLELKTRVENLHGIQPHLGVIVVGDDAATAAYVRQKKKMGEQIGAVVSVYNYPNTIGEKELEESIDFLQKKGNLHGLVIQLPLPKNLDAEKITQKVDVDKDVDGFREDSNFNEPIAEAIMRILEEIHNLEKSNENFDVWLKSQKIVILGKGKTGGKPIIKILQKMSITPIIIDSKTHNPKEVIKTADILVCAVGNRGTIVTSGMLKNPPAGETGAIVIGIGMHLGKDGKLHGDYETEDVSKRAAYYTPIPGGVGPVNAAMLLANVVKAAEKNL